MGYRSHKRKTRDSEKNLLQRNCAILRRFRLSIEEMGQLKKELERADKYLQEKHRELWAAESLLVGKIEAIKKEVEERHKVQLDSILKRLQEAWKAASDVGMFKALFTNERKERQQLVDELEALRSAEWHKILEESQKEQAPIELRLNELRSKRITGFEWWNQPGVSVSQKEVVFRGERKILAREFDCFPLEKSFAVIDILIKEQEKKEALDALKVRAASSSAEARKLAQSVKKRLVDQLKVLNVCPYCGKPLNLATAHADHIYPISKGGRSVLKNMVYVCDNCNILKNDKTLTQFIRIVGYDRHAIESRLYLLRKDF